jgi:hypothetical protein
MRDASTAQQTLVTLLRLAGVLMHLLQRQAHNRALRRAKTCPEEELFAESRCDESKDIARIQEVFCPKIWIVPIRPNHIINKQMMDPAGQEIFFICSRPRQCLSCIHLFTLSYTHTHMRSHRAEGQMDGQTARQADGSTNVNTFMHFFRASCMGTRGSSTRARTRHAPSESLWKDPPAPPTSLPIPCVLPAADSKRHTLWCIHAPCLAIGCKARMSTPSIACTTLASCRSANSSSPDSEAAWCLASQSVQ